MDIKEINIVPTVMPEDHQDFVEKINRVAKFVSTIQIDVMDGRFVPSKSWPYKKKKDLEWQKYLNQDRGLPHWKDVDFEVDLMVTDQVGQAEKWIDAGVMRIIAHFEALQDGHFEKLCALCNERNTELYLALVPKTPNEVLTPYLDKIDGVQFMGINRIGYQGQEFAKEVLVKIAELRELKPEFPISVDGGVSFDTVNRLVKAGAVSLASGSVIFKSIDPGKTIKELKEVASE